MIKAPRIHFKSHASCLHRPRSNVFQPNSLLLAPLNRPFPESSIFLSPLLLAETTSSRAQGSSCIAPSPNPNPNPVRSLKMIPENTHLDKTGKLANRRISSIVRTPARAAALVSVLQGGLSTDQCSGHSAGRHRGNPRPQASASTVSKCQALEMSDAGCSGHRPNKQLQSPGTSIWSTSSIAACLSPKDSLLPLLPLIPMSLQTHQAPHTADT